MMMKKMMMFALQMVFSHPWHPLCISSACSISKVFLAVSVHSRDVVIAWRTTPPSSIITTPSR